MSGSPTPVTGDRLVSSPETVALSPEVIDTWTVPLADAMYECCITTIPDTDHDEHVMEHLRRNGWTFQRIAPSVT